MQYIYIIAVFFALVFDRLNIFLFFILSCICHEIGHILVCKLFRYKPVVTVSVFGAKLKGYPVKRYQKLAVLLAGPCVNLVFVLITVCILSFSFSLDIYVFCCVNSVILLFNLLPVSFLDGGQILGLFVQNHYLQKLSDVLSVVIIFTFVICFSFNIFHSLAAAAVFAVYCLVNRAK